MTAYTDLPQRDSEQALRIAGGSEQLAADLYARFLSQLPGTLAETAGFLERADWDGLRDAVHRLSGATAACALPRLAAMLDALGSAARAHDTAAASACFDELRACAKSLPDQIG